MYLTYGTPSKEKILQITMIIILILILYANKNKINYFIIEKIFKSNFSNYFFFMFVLFRYMFNNISIKI